MFNLAGYGPTIFAGTMTTIELSFITLVVSFLLGLLGASAKLSKSRIAQGIATVYTTIIRGVPDLVLMLLLFYSLQIWLNDFTDYFNLVQFNLDPFTAASLRSASSTAPTFTETFRGAFMAVPRGQMEAARSLGMRPLLGFRRILFPQMMRYALPGLANNWQVILKATALVSIITLSDVVKATQDAGKGTFRTFYFSLIAGVVYLVLTTVSNGVLLMLTKRYAIGTRKAAL